jgi:membrane protein DedA with SNARE-associated domain
METLIYNFLPRVESFGLVVYWLVFLMGVFESLPFIGLFIPGTLLLIGLGLFASEGTLHIIDLIWVSSLGVIIGDTIGYYVGKHKGRKLIANKFISPKYFEKLDIYFAKHGSKSVFIGRFIGPLRPFIAFGAGMHHMGYYKFLLYTTVGGFLWSAGYLLLGFYFGEQAKSFFLSHNRFNFLILFIIFLLCVGVFKWIKLKKSKIIY